MQSPNQDEKFEQTENQRDPYRARPEDFTVNPPDKIASSSVPGNGQRGNTRAEFARLLAIRASKAGKSHPANKGLDLPTATDKAGPPHIASRRVFKQRRTP
jgi:hypothetical protein